MDFHVTECFKHTDSRGYLVEFLRGSDMGDLGSPFGQIYFVTFERPFQVRGNHYHTRGTEWFGVAHGELEVILEDVQTKEREKFILRSDDRSFTRLTVGANVAHAFRNLSPTAVLLDYCTEEFDPRNLDRHPYLLLPPTME
ncbi:MAG: WxcM-like domain-containing protein [Planctomycetota bacterium]